MAVVAEDGHYLGILSERMLAEAVEVLAAQRQGAGHPPTPPEPAPQSRYEHHHV